MIADMKPTRKKGKPMQTMTLTIENVKPEFLSAFKDLAKSSNAIIIEQIDETDECPICKAHGYTPSDSKEMREALKESKEISKNPHLYPSYASVDELMAALEADEAV